MTPKESLQAIRVSHAFCAWPAAPASTGQILRALNAFYELAYQDGATGRVSEGYRVLQELMESAI